ncbi:toxin-antitoxin system, toxin component, PIN family [delta proteobacterium NaphS2]|nr:toxin-antitoxin system, toxin component, PIN family [delta proteobacterium NaphS2]
MKILFDTNVILDVLLDRKPFSDDAAFLMSFVEQSEIMGFICATTVTTIYYLAAKALGHQAASRHIRTLLNLFVVAPVNRVVLEGAAASKLKDFEDAVIHASAIHAGAEYIVTRNSADFKESRLPVFSPTDLINNLESLKE